MQAAMRCGAPSLDHRAKRSVVCKSQVEAEGRAAIMPRLPSVRHESVARLLHVVVRRRCSWAWQKRCENVEKGLDGLGKVLKEEGALYLLCLRCSVCWRDCACGRAWPGEGASGAVISLSAGFSWVADLCVSCMVRPTQSYTAAPDTVAPYTGSTGYTSQE